VRAQLFAGKLAFWRVIKPRFSGFVLHKVRVEGANDHSDHCQRGCRNVRIDQFVQIVEHIIPEERIQETLRYMGRPSGTPLLLPLAREVCERLDAKALLAGSIASSGTHYVISLDAVNCLDGNSLAHQQAEAESKEQVLRSLGEIAMKVRRKLGESLGTIQRFDVPIQQATTASLEALKAYAVARQQRAQGMEADSIPFFKHALEVDPSFAMAYAQLAQAYQNLGETDQAAQYLKKGRNLLDHVTVRERFFLLSRYYFVATGEVDKSIETAQLWAQTYPADWMPFDWLAGRYIVIGEYEKAVGAAHEALHLAPDFYTPYANLALAYRSLNQLPEAKAICEKAIAAKRDSSYIHESLYQVAFCKVMQQRCRDNLIGRATRLTRLLCLTARHQPLWLLGSGKSLGNCPIVFRLRPGNTGSTKTPLSPWRGKLSRKQTSETSPKPVLPPRKYFGWRVVSMHAKQPPRP
jgi:tetratricopeptide (TPR) repeat protein